MFTKVKTAEEIENIKVSGRMLATVLQYLRAEVKPGQSTKDVANMAAEKLNTLGGGKPAFLGYQGFPDVICISLNNEVVHGIPRENRIIEAGDIVSLDFGVNYKGMITDSAISFLAGGVGKPSHKKLIERTEQSLMAGIACLHDGVKTGDIGSAVQAVLDKFNYGIVRDLVGHGVGHQLHEAPDIPNYGRAGHGPKLKAGMTIAIEPMATLGTDRVWLADDGWTILTQDNSWAAHFEHTILITEDGAEIITTL